MTATPGWYADPQTPSRTRWWDGSRWTEHTAATAGWPVADSWRPPESRPLRWRAVTLALVIVAVIATAAVAVVHQVEKRLAFDGPPNCGTVVTSSMPRMTAAYVRIATVANQSAEQLSSLLKSHDISNDAAILWEIDINVQFDTAVWNLPLTGQARADAKTGIATDEVLDQDLTLARTQPRDALTARINGDYSAESFSALRVDLGLSPRGTCYFTVPN